MQGCCAALALAARGAEVVLYERAERLLTRAAVANEGKIHLGYMYANDPGLATARMMVRGAFDFAPFLSRHLGIDPADIPVSAPATYVVHRDSQRSVEEVAGYLEAVHRLVGAAEDSRRGSYFGREMTAPLRRWAEPERGACFDPAVILAAFDSPEIAVNPVALTDAIGARVADEPAITLRLFHDVHAVEDADAPVVVASHADATGRERFDHVVNALWEGRLAIDATLGLAPRRPWLHRLKYGVSFRLPDRAIRPPSTTVISGPFGEVVTYPDGSLYLTWYPTCLRALSSDLTPPNWPSRPSQPDSASIAEGTLAAMAAFVAPLRGLCVADLSDLVVRGGAIVAWGATDIYDVASELHHRFEIGVSTHRQYHSVDPGKLTLAPHFAEAVADRILAGRRT